MNFELNDEQRALRDSLERLLADRCGFEQRRALAAGDAGHDPQTWQALADMGVTALLLPEAQGGFARGACDLLPVMQALGRSLCLEPVLAGPVLAATAVAQGADAALQDEVLAGVASGQARLAWADAEREGRHAAVWTGTRATLHDGRWLLSGAKLPVLGGALADRFVVSARVAGDADDSGGRALFCVAAGAAGLQARHFRLVDDSLASELIFDGAVAQPLADPFDGERARLAIERVQAVGIAATCADMVGAMEGAMRLAVDYVKTRQQFGRAIGDNQSLRHRIAEMQVSLEMARSLAIAAAVAADQPAAEDARADLHRAKLGVGRHARAVTQLAIQLHGGIGMTEEYAVGHYLRRIHVMDQLLGDSDAHAGRLAALL